MKRTLHSFVLTLEARDDSSFTEQGEPTYSSSTSACTLAFPGDAQAVAQTNETKLVGVGGGGGTDVNICIATR